ncbi:response regulator [Actimicrobium sp. CCC2.4]|uniref:response regulator n=1 Tax=Actimicrobium sp. CCC2.4 TaxID=3048606 RepID=UPI002AC9BEE1|nr:response regulator [Actimicrobium sp. CCC2.4]WPX32423.1 response regulator [Actimicrobium sp. CCC2.4]
MKEFRSLTALIIEPQPGMRGNLHNMLTLCELKKIDHAVSSGTAIRQLQARSFDIILCEYDLGDGQDGQQFLEDVRHNKLISMSTIFFMVTAERAYEKVVSAAELAPSDYILKPFTADTLMDRIAKAVEKRAVFASLYRLMERGDLNQAVAACLEGEAGDRRYLVDFKRLRAELHILSGEPHLAEPLYAELYELRAVAWARLGLAKTLFLQNKFAESEEILIALVAENNKFMDAHDWLAKAHEANGKFSEAQAVLQNAVMISPNALQRLRKLGEIAFETGDVGTAEKAFQQVVTKARYSEFRDPEDHVRLVKTLVSKGDTSQAATIIRDLDRSLSGSGKGKACHAISSAMLFKQTGDLDRSSEELNKAVEACRDNIGLSTEMKMTLAKNCLEQQMDSGATEIMLDVMNNASSSAAMAKAVNLFEQSGRADLAQSTAKESRRMVVDLVASGAEKARQGDYGGAVTAMMEAVKKLPGNPQVVFNAAVALLKHLDHLGWDERLADQARTLIDSARRLDAANPRLASLTALHHSIMKKYGIAPAAAVAAPGIES